MSTIVIEDKDWTVQLSEAIRLAKSGSTIVVSSKAQEELAIRAIKRSGRTDLIVEIRPKE